jgi:peptidylprolyl isomerase
MPRTVRSALLLTLAALVVLLPAACGKDKKSGGGGEAFGTKPTVRVPSGNPPTTLQKTDLIVGKGAEATPGKKVTVQYVGVAFSNKEQFDASWDRGAKPFPFTIGAGNVIKGWDEGVPGMKVGGRRQLVIPPDLAYGSRGYPPIGPNETLVFVVDLLSVA